MNPRELLLDCYRAALEAVDARRCVRESLQRHPVAGDWHVVAIGKAAGAMSQGAVDALDRRVAGGLVVVPPMHLPAAFSGRDRNIVVAEGAHPLPDERSLAAGEALVDFVTALPVDAQVLCLVSGGASSLAEVLRPGVTLGDLQALNRWALASGAPIDRVNAMRRRLSRLKGGGLARLIDRRRCLALMVSDVPGDDPRVLGSGLLHAPSSGSPPGASPPELAAIVARADAHAAGSGAATPRVPVRRVATLRQAREAAAQAARARDCVANVAVRRFAGDAAAVGARLAARVSRLPPRTVQVWGGESTVSLPAQPGRGGRSQHLALAAALVLERTRAADAVLLAAGTDGIDGATADAGAIVDGETCVRGRDAGCDPRVSLDAADSGSFLEAAGDLLHTGPTLTNVGDLVLGLGSVGDG